MMRASIITILFGLLLLLSWQLLPPDSKLKHAASWQRLASPGKLSSAHSFLESNCNACHTAVRGIETINCSSCHANEESLLQRQPTVFHVNISSCMGCHTEHRGKSGRLTTMDHERLAKIGINELHQSGAADSENALKYSQLIFWLREYSELAIPRASKTNLSPKEALLNCSTCHSNDDRHFKLFGEDCSLCHGTPKWSIPEFRHPSPASLDCAQCHQAPPSHYMMHFKMISQRVAGKKHAKIEQCYKCHQTTSWNDIKDAGWYKHH